MAKKDDLQSLVRQEKMSSSSDFHQEWAKSLSKNKKFANMSNDDQFDLASEDQLFGKRKGI